MLSTTTVTVVRTASGDPYETASTSNAYVGLPAHVSALSGTDGVTGGDQEVVTAVAYLPAGTVIERTDRITDAATAVTYAVVWSRSRQGLGLDHVHVGLRAVAGASNG
jgi:hypothetical protein